MKKKKILIQNNYDNVFPEVPINAVWTELPVSTYRGRGGSVLRRPGRRVTECGGGDRGQQSARQVQQQLLRPHGPPR